jgi:hypothetical protein
MAEVTLTIGAAAVCGDGFPGELKSLVVDPASRAVTHLVIEPERGVEFKDLSPAEETLAEFVPGYEVPVQLLPAGEGWRAADGPVADGETIPQIREMETIPLIPDNEAGTPEVEESGADHVRATDGEVGRLHGLRVDPASGEVLQVLLKKHAWGHAELAIPISRVSGFDAGVQLSITRQEVKNLA